MIKRYYLGGIVLLIGLLSGCAHRGDTNLYDEEYINTGDIIITNMRTLDQVMNKMTTLFYPAEEFDPVRVEQQRGFYKDNYTVSGNIVYYRDEPLEGSDPASFIPLLWSYAVDDYALYIAQLRYPLDTQDLKLFRDISTYVISNGKVYSLFYDMNGITQADAESFTPLSYRNAYGDRVYTPIYAQDKNYIYHQSDILTGADYDTFEVLKVNIAKDKNHVYDNGTIVTEDIRKMYE